MVDHIFADLDFVQDFQLRDEVLKELSERLEGAPVAIHRPLAGFVPEADKYQQQVVEASASTMRVVAPAGSGKTQTMLNRVLRRVQQGLNPERLLLLTFDKAAATSLVTKLREQTRKLGVDLGSLKIKTLNAFGLSVLRDYVPEERKDIIPNYCQIKLIREVSESLKGKSLERHRLLPRNIKLRFYLDFFSLLKNELFDPRGTDSQRLAEFIARSPQAGPFFEGGQQPTR